MKITIFVFLILLTRPVANAQSLKTFEVLNPIVQQGDVLIVRISPQWMPPATSNPTIFIFGKHYRPNGQGKVLIGVDVEEKPDKYIATFNENRARSGWDYEEIEVLKTSFDKTRISSFTEEPNPRIGSQYQRIRDTFGVQNQSRPDLTDGLGYVDPLGIVRDAIDPFGFIYTNNPYRSHDGVDLRAKVGTQVRAINSGKVVLVARNFRTEGNMLILSHGLEIFSVYMHLSKFQVKEGDMVKQKQVIALSGRSGRGVREPHLHFNIKIVDSYIDPLKFIDTVNQYITP